MAACLLVRLGMFFAPKDYRIAMGICFLRSYR